MYVLLFFRRLVSALVSYWDVLPDIKLALQYLNSPYFVGWTISTSHSLWDRSYASVMLPGDEKSIFDCLTKYQPDLVIYDQVNSIDNRQLFWLS